MPMPPLVKLGDLVRYILIIRTDAHAKQLAYALCLHQGYFLHYTICICNSIYAA